MRSLTLRHSFNLFGDETLGGEEEKTPSNPETFNSFEDETRRAGRVLPHPSTTIFFQFLWGWNFITSIIKWTSKRTSFNSFEDETPAVDERNATGAPPTFNSFEDETHYTELSTMRPETFCCFQFLWGWNLKGLGLTETRGVLSIPLRMKHVMKMYMKTVQIQSFNSFEDETPTTNEGSVILVIFQFLWGWNERRWEESGHGPNP